MNLTGVYKTLLILISLIGINIMCILLCGQYIIMMMVKNINLVGIRLLFKFTYQHCLAQHQSHIFTTNSIFTRNHNNSNTLTLFSIRSFERTWCLRWCPCLWTWRHLPNEQKGAHFARLQRTWRMMPIKGASHPASIYSSTVMIWKAQSRSWATCT